MSPRIERRLPSPVQRSALLTQHGVVFKDPDRDLEQEFTPADEVDRFFGTPDSYVAHRLLTACGHHGMVEEEER